MQRERQLLESFQEALAEVWEPSRYTYSVQNVLPSQIDGAAKPLPAGGATAALDQFGLEPGRRGGAITMRDARGPGGAR